MPPYEVPWVPFEDIYLDLNLPENQALRMDGGYRDDLNGGVRGLILYRVSATDYKCYEMNCTWDSMNATSNVSVDGSGLFMICNGCNSTFAFENGVPLGGIAPYALQQYRTYLDEFGGLTITDEIVL